MGKPWEMVIPFSSWIYPLKMVDRSILVLIDQRVSMNKVLPILDVIHQTSMINITRIHDCM
jgi:hypothetical protein